MDINLTRHYQALQGWFLGKTHLRWCLAGFCLHKGLLEAKLAWFVLSLLCIPAQPQTSRFSPLWFSLGVLYEIFYYLPSIYYTVGNTHIVPLIGVVLLFWSAWYCWSWLYIWLRQHDLKLAIGVMFFSIHYWEYLGLGVYNPSLMLAQSILSGIITHGHTAVAVLLLCLLFMLHTKQWRWFLLPMSIIPIPPLAEKVPPLIEGAVIYPEGLGRDVHQGNALVSRRLRDHNNIYHASTGLGVVQGVSLKRHLSPIVESGYTPGEQNRIVMFNSQPVLVLICNDALFSDIWEEAKQANYILIMSHLSDLSDTPIKQYFMARGRYIHLITGKPVYWVDQDLVLGWLL